MARHELLKNVTVTTVKPHQKTNHQDIIYPTFIDQWIVDCSVPSIYAYRLSENSDEGYALFVNQIKTSLEKILVPFFPFAGRWVPNEKYGRQLNCNDEGVPFVEAEADKDLDSVVKASGRFQPVTELNGFEILGLDSSLLQQKMLPGGLPSVFVQVTRFRCGGVVLGVTCSHTTSDGKSFFDFMLSWSEMARTNAVTIKPNFNRSLATTFEAAFEQMGGRDTSDPFLRSIIDEVKSPFAAQNKSNDWATRIYEVSIEATEALKLEAKNSTSGQYISRNDCILAQLTKLSAALSPTLGDGKVLVVGNLVDGRERFYDSPVPNLVGNVAFPVYCPIPASEAISRPRTFGRICWKQIGRNTFLSTV